MWLVSYRTWSGTREGDALSEEVTGPQGDEEAEDAAAVVGDTVGVPWGNGDNERHRNEAKVHIVSPATINTQGYMR